MCESRRYVAIFLYMSCFLLQNRIHEVSSKFALPAHKWQFELSERPTAHLNMTQKVEHLRHTVLLMKEKQAAVLLDPLGTTSSGDLDDAGRRAENVRDENRTRRYAYEDTHEWPKDGSVAYDFDDGTDKELTLWDKLGQNWQAVFMRVIFMACGLSFLLIICCCCCQIACKFCCYNLKESCRPCPGLMDIISSFFEDPMYKRAKNLAELMGLKLDYKTYMKIKATHDLGGTGSYNPLGLPYME